MRKLLFLFLLTPISTDAYEGPAFGVDVDSSLEAVTVAAGLPPQLSAKEDELRIWVRDYMGESITGYLITKPSGYKCEATTSYMSGVTSITSAKCRRWRRNKVALPELANWAPLDGKDWDCDAQDGYDVFVEGLRDGKQFRFRAGNPGFCKDPDSQMLFKFLRLLW
jgi:hypothetical protein